MIQFTRLRLNGFKSFVDKTELEITPGLNGIVGPNGCGKSNLVEALRWVMGENSAKRMRGDGMDDVIFAGTDKRSARNFAEVSLVLDNTSRTAPAAYNGSDEIEVVRRIERDQGSLYRINGKTARARDVQMLFADTVTGANSPSLVSQGHVTRMINAKPHDRRLILEESAGIAGLYARRHEAELRLKAADTNLIRVQDILGSMENRLSNLKRQARQASKYRNLNAQIRQFELIITYLEWQILQQKKKAVHEKFTAAESIVADKLSTVTQLTKTQSTQVEDLPSLRKQEAEISAALQVQRLTLQRLEDEAERYQQTLKELKDQITQTEIDQKHEEHTLQESTTLLERIQAEHTELLAQEDGEDAAYTEKQDACNALELEVLTLEERFTAMKENAAESRARQDSLEHQIKNNKDRISVLNTRIESALHEKEALTITEESMKQIGMLEESIIALEENLAFYNTNADNARKNIKMLEDETDAARQSLSAVQKQYVEFTAEITMLERYFKNKEEKNFTPVLDSITTESGFEKALARALGDSLMASIDASAPSTWKAQGDIVLAPLPPDAKALLPFIKAPKELHLALSQIGFVTDEETGERLQSQLKAGQSLVSTEGTYWRWDGYIVRKTAMDRNALHLEQKNKLAELEKKRGDIENLVATAQDHFDGVLQRQKDSKAEYESLLPDIKASERKLTELRPALAKIREKTARAQSEQTRLDDTVKTAQEDITALNEIISAEEISLRLLLENQQSTQNESVEEIRTQLSAKKNAYQDAVRAFDLLTQQKSTRRARLQAIADERISLQNRSIRAKEHLKTLTTRLEGLNEKFARLKSQPKNSEKGKEDLLGKIADIETQRTQAANKLAECEEEVAVTGRALKDAEKTLGDAREERAHAQATYAALNDQLIEMEQNIEETLQIKPIDLVNQAAADLVKYQPSDLDNLKYEKDKLARERDAIGAVNLRADDEATELEKELTKLLHERNDLTQAIDELRGGIAKINKEAKERLAVAFDHVNAHFQRLFVRLFAGGKAHLHLIESEDPLGSGLEIFAQPPGKALQSLSLLSGGEQTLASIALIFAMFLTNPSPICVLDEIDAPLDDSNVDRVCDLLDEIAERGETRFLVITHHRLSMARMDRLYGVTMAEKGVSQLVSVDLQHSFDFLDQAA